MSDSTRCGWGAVDRGQCVLEALHNGDHMFAEPIITPFKPDLHPAVVREGMRRERELLYEDIARLRATAVDEACADGPFDPTYEGPRVDTVELRDGYVLHGDECRAERSRRDSLTVDELDMIRTAMSYVANGARALVKDDRTACTLEGHLEVVVEDQVAGRIVVRDGGEVVFEAVS